MARRRGKGRGPAHHERQVAPQRLGVGDPRGRAPREEYRRARPPLGSFEQVVGEHGREQKVVVDHLVVEQRRPRIVGRARLAQVVQRGVLADVLLVGHVAVLVQALEHRAQRGLGDLRAQHRHQQPGRQQRVAAEVGKKAPRPREELLAVAQERQRLELARVGLHTGLQQLARRDGRQGRVVGQRRHPRPHHRGPGRRLEHQRPLGLHPRARALQRLHHRGHAVPAIERGAPQHHRPVAGLHRVGGLHRQPSERGVVAQQAHAPKHRVREPQRGHRGPHHRRHAAHAVGLVHPFDLALHHQLHRLLCASEPQTHPGVPRGEGHQQPRVRARAGEQVRRDRTPAVEMVLGPPLGDPERECLVVAVTAEPGRVHRSHGRVEVVGGCVCCRAESAHGQRGRTAARSGR